MSGEGLAQRLVTAATAVIPVDLNDVTTIIAWDAEDGIPVWGPPELIARAATVAVLRELARDGHEDMRSWQPVDLEFLADSLEGKPQ